MRHQSIPSDKPTSRHSRKRGQLALPGFKHCWKCTRTLPVDDFRNEKRRSDGLRPECRDCESVLRRERKERDPEYQKRMYPRYRAKAIANAAKWQSENRDRYNEIAKKGYQRNIEHRRMSSRMQSHRRRTRIFGSGFDPIDYQAILKRDGYVCHICGGHVESNDLHFDHVIPLSKGGPHAMDNIRVAHSRCNLRKGAKLPAS